MHSSCRWCGPCKTLAPVLEGAVQNRGGRVELAKVDIDELQDLAMNYKVNASARCLLCASSPRSHITGDGGTYGIGNEGWRKHSAFHWGAIETVHREIP